MCLVLGVYFIVYVVLVSSVRCKGCSVLSDTCVVCSVFKVRFELYVVLGV